MKQVKMTITIPEDIHRVIKINSAKAGITIKEFIVEAVLLKMEVMLARQEKRRQERLKKEQGVNNQVMPDAMGAHQPPREREHLK